MLDNVFKGLSRGVPGKRPEDMSPVVTEFQAPDEIASSRSLAYSPEKIFLGVIGGDATHRDQFGNRCVKGGHPIGVATDQHMITIAGSRAGKGRAIIIPNMKRYAGSVLAIDPKGELAIETALDRAALGQKVCVIDPFGTTRGKLKEFESGFNPMSQLDRKAVVEMASLVTDALVMMDQDRDTHWDESAKTFIEAVVILVATAAEYEGRRNLVTVRDLICQGAFLESDPLPPEAVALHEEHLQSEELATDNTLGVLKFVMAVSSHQQVVRGGADFFEKEGRERSSVLSTARRHLRPLSYPEIEASLSGEGVQLAELKSHPEGMTIYLCLPARHLGTCGRWLRLFVNLTLQEMERSGLEAPHRCPVLFVLDEFASAIGHLKAIEDAAGQIAGFGVKLWPVLQDLGQLKSLYKDRWETFIANAGILQFFGNSDLTTLEWISKRLGSTTIIQKQKSDLAPEAGDAGGTGFSWSPHTTPVLAPEEIALAFGRDDAELRQLILRPSYMPMILQRAYHDQHEVFTGERLEEDELVLENPL